ncbi:MAG TPA: FHA domain-containing serine/threonine-protein kinase [Ktedonobacterales bacterium]|jgi:serine/threonine protein kinase|nr:FHA domain-containing serine/threonine-protein kinase [Ktedonobacterales bacterium]
MIGRVLKNRYKLVDERGRGSMATVYIGRDLETNRIYAVKALSREAAADTELSERFKREFELLSRISGPHVVAPVDFGDDKGVLFIVMDYVDGHTLKHAVLTGGPFPPRRAIDVIEQSAAGVATAASRGVTHRDIKPQNLLLTVDNTVKLTDFGLARSHESKDITVTGFFVGTPFYVAPEQVENSRRVDTRADLYSLGCVFFELLSGRVPYDGEHAWDVVMKHLNSPIPSVTALRPDLPANYDAFFQRALAKRPDQRFQSAQEFTEAADALLNGEDPTRIPVASGPISVGGASGTGVRGVAALVDVSSGQVFPLTAADMVIGRSDPARNNFPDIDLLPLDPSQAVSRRHARFMRRDGHCYIEDLNAFNKTRVNGRPLVPHEDVELQDGDTLRLGNIDLRFEARGR